MLSKRMRIPYLLPTGELMVEQGNEMKPMIFSLKNRPLVMVFKGLFFVLRFRKQLPAMECNMVILRLLFAC